MSDTEPKRPLFQFSIRDLLLVVVIAALAAGWWIDHQRINNLAVQKWDYKVGIFPEKELKALGDQGWEVCGVYFNQEAHTVRVFLKRPIH